MSFENERVFQKRSCAAQSRMINEMGSDSWTSIVARALKNDSRPLQEILNLDTPLVDIDSQSTSEELSPETSQ